MKNAFKLVLARVLAGFSGDPKKQKESRMKTRVLIALAVLASATLMHAQVIVQPGPPGEAVLWSESATFCSVMPGSAASSFNYAGGGSVTFAPGAYGTIGLACPVTNVGSTVLLKQLTGLQLNGFSVSFINAGQGCAVGAYLIDRTTGLNVGWSTSQSYVSDMPYTVTVAAANNPKFTSPLNPLHFYEVDIYLSVPQSKVNQCFPTAYGAYVESMP